MLPPSGCSSCAHVLAPQSIAAGSAHVIVVGTKGEVVVMGDNSRGQLGLGDPGGVVPGGDTIRWSSEAGAAHRRSGIVESVAIPSR